MGVRRYSDDAISRIRFIKKAQQLGFTLREIHELLALRADPAADCAQLREEAVVKLRNVRHKIEQLQQIGAALETLTNTCPGQGGLQACSILEALTLQSNDRTRERNANSAATKPAQRSTR
jgi:DNA-binding transcriptional MerR regulator